MTEEQRSYNMSRIRGKNTSIEVILSHALWHRGLRFRKNSPHVYGHPDISVKKYKVAIFCDGDFWHGYDWENRRDEIKSNRDYWIPKIERNMQKDIEVNHVLTAMEIRKDVNDVTDMIMNIIEEKKENLRMKTEAPDAIS